MENLGVMISVTLGAISLLTAIVSFAKFIWTMYQNIKLLMKAVQAQMRGQLLDDYYKYEEQGWISDGDMQEWENQYKAYHSLGKNGVLDSKYETLLKFPHKPNLQNI